VLHRTNIYVVLLGVLVLCIASGGVACRQDSIQANDSATRLVKDDLGREVRIPAKIERAISLAPSITESIFAAGAGDRLVGVTTYCNYPEQALAIEKVGDTQTPNIERIIALKPDAVFVSTASQLESFLGVLAGQKIVVYVSNAGNFEDVVRGVKDLGYLFGTSNAADAAAAELERRASAITAGVSGVVQTRVFVQISKEPLFTIGKTSFLTEIIKRAGGTSVTRDVPSGYPKLSKETALALDPEVIILSDSEDNPEPNAVFKNSTAVKNARVYKINADIISRPGPRLIEAMEQIAGFLHGGKAAI
jgi:iron complex transport system substrate-binding protein